jgi:predicted transcriptional regulator
LRENSKAVLGNKDRAEVGAAIGLSKDGVVNATDLALELELPNSRVRAQLVALARGGLLRAQPSISGKHMYARVETPLWEACIDLIQRSTSVSAAADGAGESISRGAGDG